MKNTDFIFTDVQLALLLQQEYVRAHKKEQTRAKKQAAQKLVQAHANALEQTDALARLGQTSSNSATAKNTTVDHSVDSITGYAWLATDAQQLQDQSGYVSALVHMSEALLSLPASLIQCTDKGVLKNPMVQGILDQCKTLAKASQLESAWGSEMLRAASVSDNAALLQVLLIQGYELTHECGGLFEKVDAKHGRYFWDQKVGLKLSGTARTKESDLARFESYLYADANPGVYSWNNKPQRRLGELWRTRAAHLTQLSERSDQEKTYARLASWSHKEYALGNVLEVLIKSEALASAKMLCKCAQGNKVLEPYANTDALLYEHVQQQYVGRLEALSKKSTDKWMQKWEKKLPFDYEQSVLGTVRAHDPVCLVLEQPYTVYQEGTSAAKRAVWLEQLEQMLPKKYFEHIDPVRQHAWIQSAISGLIEYGLEAPVWQFLTKHKVFEPAMLYQNGAEVLVEHLLQAPHSKGQAKGKKIPPVDDAQQVLKTYIEQGALITKWHTKGCDLNHVLLERLKEPFVRAKVMGSIDLDVIDDWKSTDKGKVFEHFESLLLRPSDNHVGLSTEQLKHWYETIQEALLHCQVQKPGTPKRAGYALRDNALSQDEREQVQQLADVCAKALGQNTDPKAPLRL